jgi:hypothetical protein
MSCTKRNPTATQYNCLQKGIGLGKRIGQNPRTLKEVSDEMMKDEIVFRMKVNQDKILQQAGLRRYPMRIDRVGKNTLLGFLRENGITRI